MKSKSDTKLNEESRIVIIARWADNNKWQILQAIGFGIIALTRFYSNGISYSNLSLIDLALAIGLIFWAVGFIIGQHDRKQKEEKLKGYEDLKERLNTEEEFHYNTKKRFEKSVERLFEQLLRLLVDNEFKFSASDRISFYCHDKSNNEFKLMARYSEHPDYRRPKRFRFPNDQGCISKAWKDDNGTHYKGELPKTDSDDYLQIMQKEYNMKSEDVNGLRMPSRFYYAQAIKNNRNERLAVIVIESTQINKYEETKLKNLCDNNSDLLVEFLEHSSRLDPIIN